MKRTALCLAAVLALAFVTSTSFAAPKSGAKCNKHGQVQNYQGTKFTCIKKNGKLVWDKGTKQPSSPTKNTSGSSSTPGNQQNGTPNNSSGTNTPSPSNNPPQPAQPSSCKTGNLENDFVKEISASASDVKFTSISPLKLELEDAIRIEIEAKNQGTATRDIYIKNITFGWKTQPKNPIQKWYIQFFQITSSHATLKSGESKVFAWHLDPIDNQIEGQIEPNIRFDFEVNGERASLTVDFGVFQMNPGDLARYGLTADSEIRGVLRDSNGNPISDVDVDAWLFNMKERYQFARTDFGGRFIICIPSEEMLRAKLGGRSSPYPLVTYLVAETKQGYAYAAVAGERGKSQSIEITVRPSQPKELMVKSAVRVATNNGWWRAREFNTGFAVVDGRHPPELGIKGSVVIIDRNGALRKQMETGNECWGLDVTNSGLIAAGCHDGVLYVWDSNGTLLWKKIQTGSGVGVLNRWVKFSPDGTKLITGPYEDDVELLDAQNGKKLWGYSATPSDGRALPRLLRHAAFSKDGRTVVISLDGGWIAKLQVSDGKVLWGDWLLGEFAMSLEVDKDENVYAVGKSREVLSLSTNGSIRWRTLAYEASGLSAESALLDQYFIVSSARSLYAVDIANGKIVWWHPLNALYSQSGHVGSGHNALDVDPVRGLIVHGAGTPGGGSLIGVLTKEGALVATKQFDDLREKGGEILNVNHIGAASVLFTGDSQIIAVFGDGYIRVLSVD